MSSQFSFKQTPIGLIPKEWEVVRLGDVINVLPGFAFSSRHFNKDEGIPLIRIRDLGKNSTEAFYSGSFDDEYIVNPNEILVGMDGEFNAYLWKGPKGLLNQRVCKIWPKDGSKIDKLYLYYVVHRPLEIIEYRVGQTTVKHLSTNHFDTVFIPLPPLPEQRRIAEILSTVDEAIQRVDEAIARTERLKRGLMQRLLTRGIGHKEIKDTEIGGIPEDWEVVKLGDICEFKRGFSYRSDQIIKNIVTKIRFITINDLEKEGGLKRTAEKIYLKEGVEVDSTFSLNEEDVLIANTDMSKGFIIGAPILIENKGSEKLVYSMDLTKLIFDKSAICSKFLFYLLEHEPIRRKMKTFAQGTNVLHLNHDLVKILETPLPPLFEQRKIVEILSTVDKKLELERKRKEKLARIKKGLMNDLLTGKKRVVGDY